MDDKQFGQILDIINQARKTQKPIIIIAAGDKHLGVFAQGTDQTAAHAIITAMKQDPKIERVFTVAVEINRHTSDTQAYKNFKEGLRNLVEGDDDLEHDPLDCPKCPEHGKCEIEKKMNEMLVKKFSSGKTFEA